LSLFSSRETYNMLVLSWTCVRWKAVRWGDDDVVSFFKKYDFLFVSCPNEAITIIVSDDRKHASFVVFFLSTGTSDKVVK
jgi:hypothetical protein